MKAIVVSRVVDYGVDAILFAAAAARASRIRSTQLSTQRTRAGGQSLALAAGGMRTPVQFSKKARLFPGAAAAVVGCGRGHGEARNETFHIFFGEAFGGRQAEGGPLVYLDPRWCGGSRGGGGVTCGSVSCVHGRFMAGS
jgi:hypothetical protein